MKPVERRSDSIDTTQQGNRLRRGAQQDTEEVADHEYEPESAIMFDTLGEWVKKAY